MNIKKKIIYIGGFELPDKNAAAHRVINLGKIFYELDYDVEYIGITHDDKSVGKQNYNGVNSINIKYPVSKLEWLSYLVDFRTIRQTIIDSKPDLVICYNLSSILLSKTINFCRINGIKIINDVTEWYGDERFLKKLDTTIRMRYLNKKVDGNICISSFLQEYYADDTDTITLPPLIDLKSKKWDNNFEKNGNTLLRLVYSGSPGKNKDKLDKIIEAFYKIEQNAMLQFDIIGITEKKYLEYYPNHKNILTELSHTISFKGRLSHKEAIEYVKKADFQIFIRESNRVNNAGFPTKFVESMACGTPVITTNTSDLENYLTNGINGYFVDYDDEKSLINILNEITKLTNTELSNMQESCYSISIQSFDYRNYITKVKGFLAYI